MILFFMLISCYVQSSGFVSPPGATGAKEGNNYIRRSLDFLAIVAFGWNCSILQQDHSEGLFLLSNA